MRKNIIIIFLFSAIVSLAHAQNEQSIFISNNDDVPIPDANEVCGTATTSITIDSAPPGATVSRLAYSINVQHTYPADLVITLVSADQNAVQIWNGNGGTDDAGFDDDAEADEDIELYNRDATSAFQGALVNQQWTLIVSDCESVDIGFIDSFELVVSYVADSGQVTLEPLDVMLIIDSSGSMGTNDRGGQRLNGSRIFVDTSSDADQIGVISYSSTASLISPLQLVGGNRDAIKSAINSIPSSGNTNIREGIELACQELKDQGASSIRAAILLTDGRHNRGSFDSPQTCFADENWPIFTFGFGSADDNLLQMIANDTGGDYVRINSTLELNCEFANVRLKLSGLPPSPCLSGIIQQGQTIQYQAVAPNNAVRAVFSTTWPGSDIKMTLISPSGRVIDRDTTSADVISDVTNTSEVITVINPEAGSWTASLFGADIDPGGEEYVFSTAFITGGGSTPPPNPVASKLYIGDNGTDIITASDIDGGNAQPLISGSNVNNPQGIAVDDVNGRIYWSNNGDDRELMTARLDGTDVQVLYTDAELPGDNEVDGIAIDATNGRIYFTDRNGQVLRAALDGSGSVEVLFDRSDDLGSLRGIALDVVGGKVYWTDTVRNRIQRGNLDGTGTPENLFTASDGLDDPYGIALDVANGKIYWTDDQNQKVQQGNLDGSGAPEDLFTSADGLDVPYGIALDLPGGQVYWADAGTNKIQRGSIRGIGAPQDVLTAADGLIDPYAVAFATAAAPPQPQTITVAFANSANIVNEGATPSTPINLIVTTSDGLPTQNNVSVTFNATASNGAVAGSDFQLTSTTLTVPIGTASSGLLPVPLVVLDDNLTESDEVVFVTLEDAVGAAIGTINGTIVTILDNDQSTTLVTNGTFDTNIDGWLPYNLTGDSVAGAAQLTRTDTTDNAILAQTLNTGGPVPPNTGYDVSIDLGNSSNQPKYVTLLLWEFNNLNNFGICFFTVPANTPLATYTLQTNVGPTGWNQADLWLFVDDFSNPSLLVDNVAVAPSVVPVTQTSCNAPLLADDNMVVNGGFDLLPSDPDAFYFQSPAVNSTVTNNTLEMTRGTLFDNFGNPQLALLSQNTRFAPPAGTPIQASVDLGNTSDETKLVSLHLWAFPDETTRQFCVFTVPPNTPLQTYTMQLVTNANWTNADVQLYVEDFGEPWLLVDNVSLSYAPNANITGLACQTQLVADRNLLMNGDFEYGNAFFGTFGTMLTDTAPGATDLYLRATTNTPDRTDVGAIFQPMFFDAPVGTPFEVSVVLQNPTAETKGVALRLWNFPDESDPIFCFFTLPPNAPAIPYTMRGVTQNNWTDISFELFLEDGTPALFIDDISVQYRPNAGINGLSCPIGGASSVEPDVKAAAEQTVVEATVEVEAVTLDVAPVVVEEAAPVVTEEAALPVAPAITEEAPVVTEEASTAIEPVVTEEVQEATATRTLVPPTAEPPAQQVQPQVEPEAESIQPEEVDVEAVEVTAEPTE